MSLKHCFFGCALCFFGTLLFFGCKSSQHDSQTLIMGTNATFAPYESIGSDGEIKGFDIDLAKALAEKLGKKLIIQDMGFDALILSLEQGKVDFIMAGLSITPNREKEILMIPYQGEATKEFVLAFWKSIPQNVISLNDLKEKPIAVQIASYQEEYLTAKGFHPKSLEGANTDLILDIQYGKSAAALFDAKIAKHMKEKVPELQLMPVPLEKEFWVLGNGIGLKKNNQELAQEISLSIQELKKDGVIEEFEKKWFGGDGS